MSRTHCVAVGADHGGFELKQALLEHLRSTGHAVVDCGTHSRDAVDYPVIAFDVARRVAAGEADRGILVDGAGIGSAMAATKVRGILAAACPTVALARNAREHNDANVLTLGAGHVDTATARAIVDVFLTTDCTEARHRRRVQMIRDFEHRGSTVSEQPSLSADDVERIAQRVKELISGERARAARAVLPPDEVAQLIDHTLLRPEATAADIHKLCAEAREHSFFSVCVNPTWVREAAALLRGSRVRLCCVVGFPLGAQAPEIKALEARKAIREGAREVDMVINIGALKGGDDAAVLRDIRAVVEACRDGGALCKVILETALLTDDEKVRACEMAMRARAHFVKTSTGFSSGGATTQDIELMARTVAPKKLGVKASGGVRTLADLQRMVAAGATRIGTSSSVKILEEARAAAGRKG
jgi:deoxyribose-phosphate aldolase